MPKFIIEREIAGAGKLTPEQLQGISQTSCGVLKALGPQIQWIESYVTDDKIYCVYIAPDEDLVSLVYFYEADHDAVIEALQPPVGLPNDYAPVVSAAFLRERLDAITMG